MKNGLEDINSGFDLIIILAVLEHLRQPGVVLKKLRKIMADDGRIVRTIPHPCGNLILNPGAKVRLFSDDKEMHHTLLDKQAIIE